ncbi:MAG: ACT domain-containing protein [Euryarchaeota archaeon]|nr:ACT domain-containing protein [Euryarchaeota archaeon]
MARKDKPTRVPIARVVRDYIDTHPSIKDCLKDDLVNLSALSRQIMKDQGLASMEAILVACRRYKDASPRHNERFIKQTLAKSKVEMSSKVAIVTLRNDWQIYGKLQGFLRKALSEGHVPKVIQGSKAITLITDENTAETVEEEIGKTNLLGFDKGLVELAVTSPESIRTTPGIMAYLYGSLSSNGINVVETMSTYTDTIFIVEPQNMMRAFEVLTRCIQA